MQGPQTILIFADPHGRIPLLLRLVWQWQRKHERRVDLVLVAGDLGVWPDSGRLDSSTRKYSQIDPAELGFQAFTPIVPIEPSEHTEASTSHLADAQELLDQILPEIDAALVFVGGNHEDYDYLIDCANVADEKEALLVPVERSGRICWLPPGQVHERNEVRIAGVSGIDPASCGRDPDRYHPASVITEDKIIDATLNVLETNKDREIDILLTHDGLPDAAKPGKGTLKLLEVIDALHPRYHFFGHYHSQIAPIHYANWIPEIVKWYPRALDCCPEPSRLRTMGVHINKLAFDRRTRVLRNHIMGLLEIDDVGQYRFEFVQDAWLSAFDEQAMWRLRTS